MKPSVLAPSNRSFGVFTQQVLQGIIPPQAGPNRDGVKSLQESLVKKESCRNTNIKNTDKFISIQTTQVKVRENAGSLI
jgi:hypothetical protein